MEEKIYVIKPNKNVSSRLNNMIKAVVDGKSHEIIEDFTTSLNLKNKKLLFAAEINKSLYDISMINFLSNLIEHDDLALENSIGSMIISSPCELGTKNFGQDILFLCNNMGCQFIGHPLVEATDKLNNLLKWKEVLNLPLEQVLLNRCATLGERLFYFENHKIQTPKILVLYSTPHKYSNTLALWHMVKNNLPCDCNIREICIENGKVQDCKGCSYNACVHFGKRKSCFYGGVMVEDVLPAIEESNIIIWLCPNYNDAIAANLTAVINRLTVLYNRIIFHDKSIFGIVVSGNSGSDSVGKQLIGALNLNKGFQLPPNSILTATANDPKSILNYENVKILSKNFSDNITSLIK